MKLPSDKLPGQALILDDDLVRRAYDWRTAHGNPPHDEVWEGLLILYPLPDNEHQEIKVHFLVPLVTAAADHHVYLGVNVSDRRADWMANYRCPDVVVYLKGTPAEECGTHWVGGPDFLIEIMSPGDLARDKLGFYAKVNTREVLIVDRDPWALELCQLQAGTLRLAGRSDLANPAMLTSGVLPLTFQLRAGTPRPTIVITQPTTGQSWTA